MAPYAGIEPAASGFGDRCSATEQIRHEKSAPAQVGKDAFDIWLLVPVGIMLTLETNFVSFFPAAGRLIITLQTEGISTDIGSLKAQAAVDFSVVNGAKPLFEFYHVANVKVHASLPPPSIFCRPHPEGRYWQHCRLVQWQQNHVRNNNRSGYHYAGTLRL